MNTPVTDPEHSTDNAFLKHDDSGRSGPLMGSKITLSDVQEVPLVMKFYNDNYECVGTIHFGETITFEGDAKATTECYRKAYDVPRHVSEHPTTAD